MDGWKAIPIGTRGTGMMVAADVASRVIHSGKHERW